MNASSESGLWAATISRGRGVISQEEYISVYTGCSRKGWGKVLEETKRDKGWREAGRREEKIEGGRGVIAKEEYISVYTGCSRKGWGKVLEETKRAVYPRIVDLRSRCRRSEEH